MGSEFAQRVDLQIVRYAQVWEDHRILEDALCIGPEDEVLSIGSAGCNVLALLAKEPSRITAVDVSPAQNALFLLKLAAIRRLSHGDFLILMGSDPDGGAREARTALYQELRVDLPDGARQFWDTHGAELEEGLMHCGRLERYLQGFHRELSRIHGEAVIERLFGFTSPPAQGEYFRERVATPEFCALYRSYFGRDSVAARGRDPSQYRYVTVDPGAEGLRWLHSFCDRVLLSGNPYMIYWMRGRARIADVLAAHRLPHLRPDSYAALRSLLPRLRVVLDDVQHLLQEEGAGRFSKANLSDVFEYMSESEAEVLFTLLAKRLRPGGRLAYWNLLVPRSAGVQGVARLRSLTREAKELHLRDRLYLYSAFHIEETVSQ